MELHINLSDLTSEERKPIIGTGSGEHTPHGRDAAEGGGAGPGFPREPW